MHTNLYIAYIVYSYTHNNSSYHHGDMQGLNKFMMEPIQKILDRSSRYSKMHGIFGVDYEYLVSLVEYCTPHRQQMEDDREKL